MKTQKNHRRLRNNNQAVTPAISTVILTAAVIAMILVAMSYANNILSLKIAKNEFDTNKQFMQTTGQQIDDIAWTVGRTQTVSYSSQYGNVKFQEAALTYTFQVHTSTGWETLNLACNTGIVLYNMPVSSYTVGSNYFERVPSTASNSFLLSDSTSPISQVICEEKMSMADGSYTRIALVPTIRMLTSTVTSTNYYKFYLPDFENGTNHYKSQSVTLTGEGISKITRSGVDQVRVTVSFPKAASLGFDSSFFKFDSTTITLDGASSPKIMPGSIVEFYLGKIVVVIGQV